jgi:hypothetical protein
VVITFAWTLNVIGVEIMNAWLFAVFLFSLLMIVCVCVVLVDLTRRIKKLEQQLANWSKRQQEFIKQVRESASSPTKLTLPKRWVAVEDAEKIFLDAMNEKSNT